jgi:lipoic acid synthetase
MAGLPILHDDAPAPAGEQNRSPVPAQAVLPRPAWLRVKAPGAGRTTELQRLLQERRLHTVCSSAACPNIGDCWAAGTATFMILGNECTRACRFCDVKTAVGGALPVDLDEADRLADAVELMGLSHVVITSVARDDLPDGGAKQFARCMRAVRARAHAAGRSVTLEVLVPDFKGVRSSIQIVLDEKPAVFNHNLETCARLTPAIRSGAVYARSLEVLSAAKEMGAPLTKTGVMLGLGETDDEVRATIEDARRAQVDILTIGQYLRPSSWNAAVERYVEPAVFAELGAFARALGFAHVESGPLVRSSYHAERAVK